MKGTASQSTTKAGMGKGKRSAQAEGQPTAEGVRDRSRMAATRRGVGRSPQSPTAVRRDALSTKDTLTSAAAKATEENLIKATTTIHDHSCQNR